MTLQETGREPPLYLCHKEVWALKIKALRLDESGGLVITPEDSGYGEFLVPAKFVKSYDASAPKPGWYWVRYADDADGYESFIPAEAFEGGYTRIA
jgi:hypothetical protein